MGATIHALFFVKKTFKNAKGKVPIYLRITINGARFEISIGRQIDSANWHAKVGRVIGVTDEAKTLNSFLDTQRSRAIQFEQQILGEGKELTIETFREKWLGIKEKPIMLVDVFLEHNRKMKLLIGKEYAQLTYIRFETTLAHTKKFLKYKYGVEDVDVKKLDYAFINEYAFWLKAVRNCNQNSTIKYLSNFKKIVNFCIQSGFIQRNPFVGFKMVKKEVVREILSKEDLEKMAVTPFPTERSSQVRDIFLFCCYTGLAYADIKKLKRSEIVIGVDGERWIFTARQKTDTPSKIPLLPAAQEIMAKYENHPICVNKNLLMPVLSNQKMNDYLKQIADLCGINKVLTFHIARHTFATTVTLSNGVPIETVSKMLGHKSLRTTQHYAKVLDLKVSQDMNALREKLEINT
ncbi:MAG TPA: site-specific integrase [Chitinophagaceae bacterium]|jgi:site-specific recombinase XerD|nr:site-specific integrase [Chitinophagaceae bacterium]